MKPDTLGRIPPRNIEAEQSVLGSILVDNEAIPAVLEIIRRDDFYKESHRVIFNAATEIFEAGEPVDLVTVSERLRKSESLEAVGGIDYLTDIAVAVPTTANVKHYARIVWEKSVLRKLIKGASDIVNMGFEARDEVAYVLDRAEQTIFDILQTRNIRGISHISEILDGTFKRLEDLYNTNSNITGVPSGFTDLDYKTSGFQNSDLVLIASRPSMGKSSLALNIAQHAAVNHQVPVAIFSLEMSREQLANRMLASELMIDNQKINTGRLEDEDWQKIGRALGPLSEAPIYIDDTPGATVVDIGAKCRRLKLEKKIGLVVVDYLQLMQGRGRPESRQQEISEISRSLKVLAKEINIPVVALSQLSRAPEARSDHRPMLSDLRESGAIEQDADIVMFIYRDDYYNPDSDKQNIAEIIISKHRNGSTGTVELRWFGEYTKFANLRRE